MTRPTEFDRILVIDWSSSNGRNKGKDSIWVADSAGKSVNLPTRHEAITFVERATVRTQSHNERMLIGWDFAFGYPAGFAAAIGAKDWEGVWRRLHAAVKDTPENKSNRFEVGAAINRALSQEPGPFWGHNGKMRPKGLHPKRYPDGDRHRWTYPFAYTRFIERHLKTQKLSASSVFQLAYNGCVGSQTLLGIAHLQGLRERFGTTLKIWPFETDFANTLSAPVICAEIYPSAHRVPDGPEVKDQRQVEAVLRDFEAWNTDGTLAKKMNAPSLHGEARKAVRHEEGWIIGF